MTNRSKKTEKGNVPYKWRLRVFSTFEEAEKADVEDILKISPEERIRNMTGLIKRIYASELVEPKCSTIHLKTPR